MILLSEFQGEKTECNEAVFSLDNKSYAQMYNWGEVKSQSHWNVQRIVGKKNNKIVNLGTYYVGWGEKKIFSGAWRCDLHASFSSDGLKILFDSINDKIGRQVYIIYLDAKIYE